MDTTTVLEIINMIESRLGNLCELDMHEEGWTPSRDELPDYQYLQGEIHSLNSLRDHLQSFIEAELNKAEDWIDRQGADQ